MARNEPQINIRLSPDLKGRIAEAAKRNRRSINAEIVDLLEDHYPEPVSLEETAQDMMKSIKFIRSLRGEELFRMLADQVDRLALDVIDKGLLSPEEKEKAREQIAENWMKRANREPPRSDGDKF